MNRFKQGFLTWGVQEQGKRHDFPDSLNSFDFEASLNLQIKNIRQHVPQIFVTMGHI